MKRRNFISGNIALGAMIPGTYASMAFADPRYGENQAKDKGETEIFIERVKEGQPHKGKGFRCWVMMMIVLISIT